jgi:hypothetical protein
MVSEVSHRWILLIAIVIWCRVYDHHVKEREREPFDPGLHYKQLSYDEKFGGMLPKICETICLTSPDHWSLGSLMICEKIEVGHNVPSGAMCQWVDEG